MRKTAKTKAVFLLLCLIMLFLCSCGADLGISTDTANRTDPVSRKAGLSGIGYEKKAYNGLFDSIADVYITIGEAELSTVLDHADSGIYCECTVKAGGTTLYNVGIKPRGNTTYVTEADNGRYSFKLKFNKYTKGQKLNGLDELNLNNMSYDPSYVREYLAYTLFSLDSGVPAPLATFAKVYINGEYYGLYLAAECVDESFLKRTFGDNDGDLYEADKGSALTSDDTSTFKLESGTDTSLSKISALYNAIANGNAEDVLDIGSVLRYAAVITVVCGQESYLGPKADSYYLYRSTENVISIIPYDLKLSFGTDSDTKKTEYNIDETLITTSVTEPYFGLSPEDRPLVSCLLEDEEYKKEYLSYVKYYNDELYGMLDKLSALKAEIDDAVKDDPRRFYDDSVYQSEFTDGDTLYGFIKARCENISSQLAKAGE